MRISSSGIFRYTFANDKLVFNISSAMKGKNARISNLIKTQLVLLSNAVNHFITLVEFFHWFMFRCCTIILLIFAYIPKFAFWRVDKTPWWLWVKRFFGKQFWETIWRLEEVTLLPQRVQAKTNTIYHNKIRLHLRTISVTIQHTVFSKKRNWDPFKA